MASGLLELQTKFGQHKFSNRDWKGIAMTSVTIDRQRDIEDGGRTAQAKPLSAEELRKMHAYWRAANYLSVGQII